MAAADSGKNLLGEAPRYDGVNQAGGEAFDTSVGHSVFH
jgi:hypothetical protein